MIVLANIAGWFVAHKRLVMHIVAGIAVLVLALWLKSCFTKGSKLDEKEIQEAQNAMREREYERAANVLANADVKEKVIAGEVINSAANTEAVKQEAKKKYNQMTPEELARELESRK